MNNNLMIYLWYLDIKKQRPINLIDEIFDYVTSRNLSSELQFCFSQLNMWSGLRKKTDYSDGLILSSPEDAEKMIAYAESLTRDFPDIHQKTLELQRTFDLWGRNI
jgi:hypothetical protein